METVFDLAAKDAKAKVLLHDVHASNVEVGRQLGVSETAVRRYRSRFNLKVVPQPRERVNTEERQHVYGVADVPEEDLKAENTDLKEQNHRLFRALSKEKIKSDRILAQIYAAARDAAENTVSTRPATKGPKKDRRTHKEEFPIIHATDWQRSKVTEDFNSEVCDRRVMQFADKVEDLTDIMRADHPVRHGVVLFTGDMLEGVKIFSGQEWEVDATMFEQLFGVVDLMEVFVRRMLGIFETVDVVCEYGNHGRIGRPSDGWKKSDNFDRIAYEIVASHLRNEDRILNFKQSPDWYQMHTVGNYTFMAIHGDEIKQFGGNLPAYGILRKANSWASGVVDPFKDIYMGHYHQSMQLQLANGNSVYMTGSVESHNEFAQEFVAGTSNPSQRVNWVNPERGMVTWETRVWLD